jgi:hypothetical protein
MISKEIEDSDKQFNKLTVSGWHILPKKYRVDMPVAIMSLVSSREGK